MKRAQVAEALKALKLNALDLNVVEREREGHWGLTLLDDEGAPQVALDALHYAGADHVILVTNLGKPVDPDVEFITSLLRFAIAWSAPHAYRIGANSDGELSLLADVMLAQKAAQETSEIIEHFAAQALAWRSLVLRTWRKQETVDSPISDFAVRV